MIENRLLLRVWSKKVHKYLTDADIWDIFDSDAEDVWELLSEVNRPTTEFLKQQLHEYGLTFEQCTGLKDKNGKLIYEGNIVYLYVKGDEEPYVGEVIYSKGGFKYLSGNTEFSISDSTNIEIVGNIHENLGLLEER